jgi:N-acetylglutamate synthase-like GNAT family acetyltransferase
VDFYHTIAKEEQPITGGSAFATGIDSPFLNVYFDLREHRTASALTVDAVNQFFAPHSVPWAWFILPATNKHDLKKHGLTLLEIAPSLYYDLSNPFQMITSDDITIEEMNDQDDLTKWIEPINEGFQIKSNDEDYRLLNVRAMKNDNKKLRHYVAYYNGKVAAAATLFISKESVMLHNLATKTKFKKRGLGTALTMHMMLKAKEMGFQHCFLDSSDEALNLYKKIGFKVYCNTAIYMQA